MENQKGRSMIEMLGVLAIVGVLSVGGIAGYSKAITKYKLNKLVEEYSLLFQQLLPHVKGLCLANTTGVYTSIATTLNNMKIIPENWTFTPPSGIKDSFNHPIAIFTRNKNYLAMDYHVQGDENLCQKLWLDVVQANANILYHVVMSGAKPTLSSYGTQYCNIKGKDCISSFNISKIIQACDSCKGKDCLLVIEFTW